VATRSPPIRHPNASATILLGGEYFEACSTIDQQLVPLTGVIKPFNDRTPPDRPTRRPFALHRDHPFGLDAVLRTSSLRRESRARCVAAHAVPGDREIRHIALSAHYRQEYIPHLCSNATASLSPHLVRYSTPHIGAQLRNHGLKLWLTAHAVVNRVGKADLKSCNRGNLG
jgi:hypothetical protein